VRHFCLDVCDIAVLSEAAHAAGALVLVGNTTPSCLGQRSSSIKVNRTLQLT